LDTLAILKKSALYVLCIAVTVGALFLAVQYLLPAAMPIVIAGLIAAVIRKPVKLLHEKLKFPEKLAAALMVLLLTSAITLVLYYLISRGCSEIVALTDGVGNFIERLKNDEGFAGNLINKISSAFPFWDLRPRLTELWINIDSSLESLLAGILEKLSGSVIPMITGAVAFVPDAILFVVVTVFSAYYLSVGGAKMKASFVSLLPKPAAEWLDRTYIHLKETAGRFLQAYMLIMAITFTELFVMFSIAKIRYAFLIALFTAIIDVLPVLGTGTVLIPWSIFLFITGNTKTAIALLIIYGIITLVRQFIEPRIVGNSVGISPFASLASMYIGLKLFGGLGLFICPMAVITVQNIIKNKSAEPKK